MREPMSAVDLAWLRMERPTNPMMIVGVLTFARRISYASLCEVLASRLLRFERFRQRPVQELTGAYWEHDPHFALDAHVHRLHLPGRGGRAGLEQAASELASTPLDPRRPLWEMHLVERFGRGSALIARFHHCYADGVALLRVLLSLTDAGPRRVRPRPKAELIVPANGESWRAAPWLGSIVSLAQNAAQSMGELANTSLQTLLHPQNAAKAAAHAAGLAEELARIALMSDDARTPLRGPLSIHKQLAWADPIALSDVKSVGKVMGCTVTDVLLAVLAGTLGAYLRMRGCQTDGVSIRAVVPINLRDEKEASALGNYFGLLFATLPIGERNPLARMREVHRNLQGLRSSSQPLLALGLLTAMGYLPAAVEKQALDLLTRKASIVVSSVPGPQAPLYLAGSPIREQHFWVPQAGGVGVGASLLSYAGEVYFGLMADRNLIPDPKVITQLFAREFEKLLLAIIATQPISSEHKTTGRHA